LFAPKQYVSPTDFAEEAVICWRLLARKGKDIGSLEIEIFGEEE
jgi:hypothetical protein